MHFTHYQKAGDKVFAVNPFKNPDPLNGYFDEIGNHFSFETWISNQPPIYADPSIKDGVYEVEELEIVWQYKCDPDCEVEWDGCLDNDPTNYKTLAEVRQYGTLFKDYSCNGCGVKMSESEIAYTNEDGYDYCKDCNEAIQSDDESRGMLDSLKQPVKQEEKGLANKQRQALIKERGEPILKLDFDVFEGNKVSMWTHFNHSANFNETKQQLIAIRDHLNEFLKDENMCPFHNP